VSRDRLITQPLHDYATEARVAAEELARDIGTDPMDIAPQHVERFRVRLVNAHGRGAKEERAHLEYEMSKLRQKVNEAMGLVQPLITRVGDLESRVSERDRTIDMMAQTMLDAGIMEDGR
jgi:hypothetical protein